MHERYLGIVHFAITLTMPKPRASQSPGEFNKNGQIDLAIPGSVLLVFTQQLAEMAAKLSHPLSFSGLGLVHSSPLLPLFRPVCEKDSNRTLTCGHIMQIALRSGIKVGLFA